MNIGAKLAAARELKGYTQQEIADRLDIPRSTWGGYELGAREPSFDMLDRICDVLDISFSWLFGSESENTGYPRHGEVRRKAALSARPVRRPVSGSTALLTLEERIILKRYRSASPDQKTAVRVVLGIDMAKLRELTKQRKAAVEAKRKERKMSISDLPPMIDVLPLADD